MLKVADHCFYCDNEIDKNEAKFVTFYHYDYNHDEALCDECYSQWLEGIKG